MNITATFCTIIERVKTLESVINSIKNQVDTLNVVLNYSRKDLYNTWDSLPKHKNVRYIHGHIGMGDANKFLVQGAGINLTLDDDIIYPSDYVQVSLNWLKLHPFGSYHGVKFHKKPLESYYNDPKDKYRCLSSVDTIQYVDSIGSGVFFWDANKVEINYKDFRTKNMADIYLSKKLVSLGYELCVFPHREGWIKAIPSTGIWEDSHSNDEIQTMVFNT